jgi:DNA repair protein RecO (recombination protein O)
MSYYKTEGIIINTHRFGEADQLITFYTKYFGKIDAICKGIRKSKHRERASLQVLSILKTILYRSKRQASFILQDWEIIKIPLANFSNFEKLLPGYYIAHLLNSFTPPQVRNPSLFTLTFTTLEQLGKANPPPELIPKYELKFLVLTGYRPGFKYCRKCKISLNLKKEIAFSISQGGVICDKCRKGEECLQISPLTREVILKLLSTPLLEEAEVKFSSDILKEYQKLVYPFGEYHLGQGFGYCTWLKGKV